MTYRRLLLVTGGVLVLLVVSAALQGVRIHLAERRVAQVTQQLEELKIQQRKKLAVLQEGTQGGASAQVKIREFLERGPTWSEVLKGLVEAMPDDLWLSDLKSFDKDTAASKKSLVLNGQAREAGSITQFMRRLANHRQFQGVFLTSSSLEGEGGFHYTFSLETALVPRVEGP